MPVSLTVAQVQNAKAKDKEYKLSDGEGRFLLVTPQGGKYWRMKYRHAGREKKLSFGTFPEVSLAEAREKSREARKLVAQGIDPSTARKAEKNEQANTFEAVALAWLEVWKHGKSGRYTAQQENRLRANIFPHIGGRPIAEVEARELVTMSKAIEKHAPELARRALDVVSMVYRYAIAHSLAPRNPARDVNPGDFLKSHTVVNQAHVGDKALPALLGAIDAYRGDQTRLALRLLALVFVRPSELTGARWDEIDFDAARWDVPASRMKMNRELVAPLSRQAVEILHQLRKMSQGEYVFPGTGGKKHMASGTFLHALKRMGYAGKQTAHGFRGLASTILHEHSFDHLHIEAQLAHVEGGVSGHYNKAEYLEQRRRMMQWYADYLDARQHGAQVIVGKFGTA
jgi:integrase